MLGVLAGVAYFCSVHQPSGAALLRRGGLGKHIRYARMREQEVKPHRHHILVGLGWGGVHMLAVGWRLPDR